MDCGMESVAASLRGQDVCEAGKALMHATWQLYLHRVQVSPCRTTPRSTAVHTQHLCRAWKVCMVNLCVLTSARSMLASDSRVVTERRGRVWKYTWREGVLEAMEAREDLDSMDGTASPVLADELLT